MARIREFAKIRSKTHLMDMAGLPRGSGPQGRDYEPPNAIAESAESPIVERPEASAVD